MDLRRARKSDLHLPPLCLGSGAFDGGAGLFGSLRLKGLEEARRMVDSCLDAGITFFDSSSPCSQHSDKLLGRALRGKRHRAILSATCVSGESISRQCEAALRRLDTEYLDLYKVQSAGEFLRLDEVLSALDHLVRSGKVRYLACSGLTVSQLTNSLAASQRHGWAQYVAHEVNYSLIGRGYETELMQFGVERGIGAIVSSPPGASRSEASADSPLSRIIEVAGQIAKETGKTIPQISLNWLLNKPTVCSVVIGARNPRQLEQSLQATAWSLTEDQISQLDRASARIRTATCIH